MSEVPSSGLSLWLSHSGTVRESCCHFSIVLAVRFWSLSYLKGNWTSLSELGLGSGRSVYLRELRINLISVKSCFMLISEPDGKHPCRASLPSLQRTSEALLVAIGFLLVGLLSLVGQKTLGKLLVVPDDFHLTVTEATMLLGIPSFRNGFIPLSTENSTHAVLGIVGPYVDRSFYTMFHLFNWSQINSSQVLVSSQEK